METIKKFLKGVWTFLNSRIFVIALIVFLFIFLAGQCSRIINNQEEIRRRDQNISALTDSLEFVKRKNGELLVLKDGYIATIGELTAINKGLADKVKDQDGKILSLTNTVIRLKQDSIELAKHVDRLNTIIGKLKQVSADKYMAPWQLVFKYDANNYLRLNGNTFIQVMNIDPFQMRHDTTYLVKFENQIELTYGHKLEKGKMRVWAESAFPGFTVKSMNGVLLDRSEWGDILPANERRWFSGFGTGPSISAGWNILEAKPAVIMGWSFHYNVYNWYTRRK